MPEEAKRQESPLFGCAVMLIIIIVAAFYVYGYFFPSKAQPTTLSLSAYFVDAAGAPVPQKSDGESHLKIKGEAYRGGKPVASGNVRVSVNKLDESFRQSISVDLKEGKFETEDVAFRVLTPTDRLQVKATLTADSESAIDELYLNTAAPTLTRFQSTLMWIAVWVVLIVFLWWFFRNFTGPRTPEKNRQAIIFSYIFGGVFLAVPLLAPVLLLQIFPNVQRAMVGMPVGLVLTRVGSAEEARHQWAINIGGYSRISSVEESAALATPTPTPSPGAPSQPTRSPGARPTQTPTPTANQSPASSPTPPRVAAGPTPTPSPTSAGTATASVTPTPTAEEPAPEENWDGVVKVEGGLVIPLYVIILSVIGGAINMTRKVPRFQGEGEYSEPTGNYLPRSPLAQVKSLYATAKKRFTNWTSSSEKVSEGKNLTGERAESAALSTQDSKVETSETKPEEAVATRKTEPAAPVGGKPPATTETATTVTDEDDCSAEAESSLNDQALTIDTDLDVLVKKQLRSHAETRRTVAKIRADVQRMQKLFEERTDERRLLGFETFEAWLSNRVGLKEVLGSNWRVELLNQYMYLISAPFLALVAYFMMDLLGLQNKLAVVVLISFSVGLVSERILSWLLGMASGYLQGGKGQPTNS